MAKATIQQVKDLGFDKIQFGDLDAAAWDVYLTAALDEIALQVADIVGTAYTDAASGSVEEVRLQYAEKYFVAAELWQRIELFERRSSRKARTDGDESPASRPLKNAELADDMAWRYMAYFGVSKESTNAAVATGYIETGVLPLSVA